MPSILLLTLAATTLATPRPVVIDTDIGFDIDDHWALALTLCGPRGSTCARSITATTTPPRSRAARRRVRARGRARAGAAPRDRRVRRRRARRLRRGERVRRRVPRPLPRRRRARRRRPLVGRRARRRPHAAPRDRPADERRGRARARGARPRAQRHARRDGRRAARGLQRLFVAVRGYNVGSDVDAARRVLAADWKAVWLAPLDATWDVQLGGDAHAALLAAPRRPRARRRRSSRRCSTPTAWATAPVPWADLQPLPADPAVRSGACSTTGRRVRAPRRGDRRRGEQRALVRGARARRQRERLHRRLRGRRRRRRGVRALPVARARARRDGLGRRDAFDRWVDATLAPAAAADLVGARARHRAVAQRHGGARARRRRVVRVADELDGRRAGRLPVPQRELVLRARGAPRIFLSLQLAAVDDGGGAWPLLASAALEASRRAAEGGALVQMFGANVGYYGLAGVAFGRGTRALRSKTRRRSRARPRSRSVSYRSLRLRPMHPSCGTTATSPTEPRARDSTCCGRRSAKPTRPQPQGCARARRTPRGGF